MVHLNYRAKKAGVKFEFNKEATAEDVKALAPEAVIVATGAKPLVPPIKGTQDYPVLTAHDFLRGKFVIPKGRVCVLGRRRCCLRDCRDSPGECTSEFLIPEDTMQASEILM